MNSIIKRVKKLYIRLYTVKSFNLMNSLIFWVPRNAKALKCVISAGDGCAENPAYKLTYSRNHVPGTNTIVCCNVAWHVIWTPKNNGLNSTKYWT
jgi:hypothetical protein